MGIEPTLVAWEATVLPLNYTRAKVNSSRGWKTVKRQPPGWDKMPGPEFSSRPTASAMNERLRNVLRSTALFLGLQATRTFPFVQRVYRFRRSGTPYRLLSKPLLETVDWAAPTDAHPPPANEIAAIWLRMSGGHKLDHYFRIYERVFGGLRQQPLRILEIGVFRGASLKMWRKYFHPDSVIVGVDIDPATRCYDDPQNNIHVRIGAQQDQVFLQSVVAEFGRFDVIIDDGSHFTSHMIASFNYLFAAGLKEQGIYFVEDTCTNYWTPFRDTTVSFVELAKQLVDVKHVHYTQGTSELQFRLGVDSRIRSFRVPAIATMLDEIRFFDSIVVFYKHEHLDVPVARRRDS